MGQVAPNALSFRAPQLERVGNPANRSGRNLQPAQTGSAPGAVDTARRLRRCRPAMSAGTGEFEERVTAVLRRFARQQGDVATDVEIASFVARLAALVVPRRALLRAAGAAKPTEAELAEFAAQVAGPQPTPALVEAARQLVKSCFYPEIDRCRDSYRAVSPDGECRRQILARARGRISGAHCVDCPHWLALSSREDAALLAGEWRGNPAVLAENPEVFLPEDYRRFRQWLHDWAGRE